MTRKLLIAALFAMTFATVVWLPTLDARHLQTGPGDPLGLTRLNVEQPVIDAVFVLDTTGSMSGLIQTAKEKIWSIASTMAAAQPAPMIRVGLVAYRDRGDAYVVRTVDLSDDLDSVYADLMQFEAGGGGDGPESVNAALEAAIDGMSWSDRQQAYRVVFLVGDAPPHTDYQDEAQYPEIVARARQQGIVVNTIQCGNVAETRAPWNRIAALGGGRYLEVGQAGSAVAFESPFDAELARLSARLDDTRLFYGSREEKAVMAVKTAAADSIEADAPIEARARRGVFNLSASGRRNRLGNKELVDAVSSGAVDLDSMEPELLPEVLKPMAPEAQRAYLAELAEERSEIESRMRRLADERDAWLRDRVKEEGGAAGSLDQKLYETVRRQAARAGLSYESGPSY